MAAGTGSFAGASSPVFAQMLDCRCCSLAQREKAVLVLEKIHMLIQVYKRKIKFFILIF